jgi:hypothetical protein
VTDFERAIKNPADVFDRPSEVLDREDLTREQKSKILHQWEYDALQREVATEENMPPSSGGGPALAEIRQALEALGETGESHPGGTKFG